MDAELSRKLAEIMGSPFFKGTADLRKNRQSLIDLCVDAETEESLPDDTKAMFAKCLESVKIADSKNYRYPYTLKQVKAVLDEMEVDYRPLKAS